jgi:integrase
MREVRARLEVGAPPRDATQTVADWLKHWRETTLAVSARKDTTKQLYAGLSRAHLEPAPFGVTPLDRLRPTDIEALILALRAKKLSDSTIRNLYSTLRQSLDGAVRDGLLARNPAALVARPGRERHDARHLDADAVAAILRAAQGFRYHTALLLIASTGLRKGECLGLAWEQVDLEAGTLRVAGTLTRIGGRLVISEPKTQRSRREIPLNPAIITLLRRHRVAQRAEKLRAGDQWHDTGLVFTTAHGRAVDPRGFLRVIKSAATKASIDGVVSVHTLRHSAAVDWLEAGTHIRAVADLLGHSSIAVTGDIYGHTSDTAARAAIDGLASRLGL